MLYVNRKGVRQMQKIPRTEIAVLTVILMVVIVLILSNL